METFHMVSITACFLGIVITVFSKLYPSEKFEKQMKTIFTLIFLLSVVAPFVNGNLSLPEINETVSASSEYYQSINKNADEYFIQSLENNISANLMSELKKSEIYPVDIQTIVNISENNSISISEVRVTVRDETDSDEVKKYVSENVGKEIKVTVEKKEG